MPDTNEQSTPKLRDFRQEVTDNIVALLEKGVAPWQKPWDAQSKMAMPVNPTTDRGYRGGNAIHLLAVGLQRNYDDPRWMTYKQASEQGWQVRKGERGTQIEFWDVKPQQEGSKDATRSPVTLKDGDKGKGDEPSSRLIHRVYSVFNARQIDDIPAPTPLERKPFEVVEAGERILSGSGAKIAHDQANHAFYDRRKDEIHLPPQQSFKDSGGYYGTALHELAHWSGHPTRLNRYTLAENYKFGDTNYAKEELRAELASVFLAAEKGIPHNPENHAAYVGSWIQLLKQDKNEIFRAAHDASKAADFVLALERDTSIADQALSSGNDVSPSGASRVETLRQDTADLARDRDDIAEERMPLPAEVSFEPAMGPARLTERRSEYPKVFSRGDQIEISKLDKEARQFFIVVAPQEAYDKYLSEGVTAEDALPNLSQLQREFLQTGLTPAEQRIVRDPEYQQMVDKLLKASPDVVNRERAAILDSANRSQLEPYDYKLSLRHQAFNAALHARPNVNQSIKEVDWVNEISQAQYRAQLARDPSFNPDINAAPAWVKDQQNIASRSLGMPNNQQADGSPAEGMSKDKISKAIALESAQTVARIEPENAAVSVTNKQDGTERRTQVGRAVTGDKIDPTTNRVAPQPVNPDRFKEASSLAEQLLGPAAKVKQAELEAGVYRGPVIGETSELFLQRLSPRSVVAHPKDLFDQAPNIGANVAINYSDRKPAVHEVKERSRTLAMSR